MTTFANQLKSEIARIAKKEARVETLQLTPTRTGKFDLLCNELCGVGHFVMRGVIVVEEEAA